MRGIDNIYRQSINDCKPYRNSNMLVSEIHLKNCLDDIRKQREEREAYNNYKPTLSDEEFKKQWEEACKKVRCGLDDKKINN